MGTIRTVYDGIGRPLTDAAAAAMQAHLAANPQGAHGGHQYSFDDLGIDRAEERATVLALPVVLPRTRGEHTMTDTTDVPSEAVDWHALLAGLDALGTRVLADDFPSTPRDRDEAFRHLAQQTLCWLSWAVFHGDPTTPIVPAPERPGHAVGRPQRRQRVPPCAGGPRVRVPHPRSHARVRGLRGGDPVGLPARRRAGHARRAHRVRGRHPRRQRLRAAARREWRRAQPHGATRRRDHVLDPRVLLRLASRRARHVHHRAHRWIAATTGADVHRRDPTKHATSPNGRSCTGTSTW